MFEHILNWKLLSGSHKFPGPDGGTCINEAAVVAAGFEYRSIFNAEDCPPCFSRVIAAYAIGLNDAMPDGLRQELLMQFVTRLAGTADTPLVERARSELIVVRTVREILPLALRAAKLNEEADLCEAVNDISDAASAAATARAAAYAADYAARAASTKIYTTAVSTLGEAICLGKQADPIEAALIIERMKRAKAYT